MPNVFYESASICILCWIQLEY